MEDRCYLSGDDSVNLEGVPQPVEIGAVYKEKICTRSKSRAFLTILTLNPNPHPNVFFGLRNHYSKKYFVAPVAGLVGIEIKKLSQLVAFLTPDHGTPAMNNCLTE